MTTSHNFIFRIGALCFLLLAGCLFSSISRAQDTLSATAPTEKEKKLGLAEEITSTRKRVFSSQLKNVAEAEKLDEIYETLETYLWDITQADAIHQKSLMSLMESQRFQYTRRLSEFKPSMDKAMADLNKNRKDFKAYLAKINVDFDTLKVGFKDEEKAAAAAWKKEISDFSAFAEKYFKSQLLYLNQYNKLVGYTLQHTGDYYYDSAVRKVKFYNVGEYTFFGETLDSLNKLSFKQRQMLRDIRPSEPSTLETP